MLSHFSGVWLFVTLWTVARLAPPLSMKFSRQEYWGGLPCPPPGNFPNPGIEAASLASPTLADRFFTTANKDSWPQFWKELGYCLGAKGLTHSSAYIGMFPSCFIQLRGDGQKTSFSISFWICFQFGLSYGYTVIKSLQISCQVSAGTSNDYFWQY